MARNVNQLEQNLKAALKAAQIDATKKAYDPNIVKETDSMEVVIQKVAEATASAFAESLAKPLAEQIHKYLDDQDFDISQLKAPNGPCTGTIKSI